MFIVSISQEEINVCRTSDINSHKSGLLHLTGQPYCKKSRSAKVKDGIINLFLRNNLIDQYSNNPETKSGYLINKESVSSYFTTAYSTANRSKQTVNS
jgi:hypothetical protein